MTVKITLGSWIKLAEEAVAARGEDYIYPRPLDSNGDKAPCLYVKDRGTDYEGPDCIIGTMFWMLDIVIPASSEGAIASGVISGLVGSGVIEIPLEDISYIRQFSDTLQANQDYGKTWGEALREAKQDI